MIDRRIMNIVRDVERYTARTLKQQYVRLNGNWWLITLGWPIRRLTPGEVAYHVGRRHAPFVDGGIRRDDPRW